MKVNWSCGGQRRFSTDFGTRPVGVARKSSWVGWRFPLRPSSAKGAGRYRQGRDAQPGSRGHGSFKMAMPPCGSPLSPNGSSRTPPSGRPRAGRLPRGLHPRSPDRGARNRHRWRKDCRGQRGGPGVSCLSVVIPPAPGTRLLLRLPSTAFRAWSGRAAHGASGPRWAGATVSPMARRHKVYASS